MRSALPRLVDTPRRSWDADRATDSAVDEDQTQPGPEAEKAPPELGLALSGGGFRAAFFHLGVLARLAETGLLRKLEVISTVSGGSIIGALYYLHLKDLLENVRDDEVRDEDYVRIVARMERAFLEAVERHPRALAYASLTKNWRMARADYSRSDRFGEIYDEIFYRPACDHPIFGDRPAARDDDRIRMRDLLINPLGHEGGFSPGRDNPGRRTPVPILLINATSLNTGHNWRFEAVQMGEDPRASERWVRIDKNIRLTTARYETIANHGDFKLGVAVAASACVPALFHPLAISDHFRYRDGDTDREIRVQLVDGGVHDNQGVCGLIDTGCKRMIVSDASGQMTDLDDPSTRIPAVAGRTLGISGDRVREEQLGGILGRSAGDPLVHLRLGLSAQTLAPLAEGERSSEIRSLGRAELGVDERVQKGLAAIRTDLDSFTEVEAHSLARFGYVISRDQLASSSEVRPLGRDSPLAHRWGLDSSPWLREQMRDPDPSYLRHLAVARRRFFKPARLDPIARSVVVTLAIVVAGLVGAGIYLLRDILTWRLPLWGALLGVTLALALLALFLSSRFRLPALYGLADLIYTKAAVIVVAPILFVVAHATRALNPLFLRAGRIDRASGGRAEGRHQ